MFTITSRVFSFAWLLPSLLLISCSSPSVLPPDTSLPPLQRLAAMDWQLKGLKKGLAPPTVRTASGVQMSRYRLRFREGRLQLSGGCNLINGIAKITEPGRMTVGPLMMTNRGCNGRLMHADTQISHHLSRVTHYRQDAGQLAMLGAKQILVFDGSPTPETLYGGKGERKFIEVRHSKQGLQWREAKYDSRWVRTNKNTAWSKARFPGIQDFKPLANHEYIVRIKAFRDPRTNKPVWIKDIVTSQGLLR